MSKNIVKYHNDLNGLSVKNWTAEDMNFFFGIISKIRNLGTQQIEFSTDEIKELIGYDDRKKRWMKVLESVGDKVSSLKYVEKSTKKIAYLSLFQRFIIDVDERTVSVKVSEDFEYIVNKLTQNFTVYELAEFTILSSTYSKTMYRILKQWRTVGEKEFSLEQFRAILEIPVSYSPGMINKRIISQLKKELPQFFVNLKIKTIKSNQRGTPIIGYKFTWIPEVPGDFDPSKFKYKSDKKPSKHSVGDFAERARKERLRRMKEIREKY